MRWRLRGPARVAFAVVVALAACKKPPPPPPEPPPEPARSAVTPHTYGYADGGNRVDEWSALAHTDASPWHYSPDAAPSVTEADFVESAPKFGASVGHTSVVFKLTFASGQKAAFKPATRRGPLRYKGEIAAYRLARALDVDTVPPAYFRAMSRAELAGVLPGEAGELFAKEAIVEADAVRGAVIPWIAQLEFIALEAEPWWSRWRGWLKRDGKIPDDARSLARDASVMVVFDFLTGNWDRWSGANIGLDRAGGRLRFIDNDGAFFETPPAAAVAKNRRLLGEVERFSKGLVAKLRAMDEDALAIAIGDETPGRPLLSDAVLKGVNGRRLEALRVVDAKIKAAGEAETLYFE